jgi:hypothetical protein
MWLGMFVAGLVLALGLPSIALASPVAFFQNALPTPGSTTAAASRMLAVTVYDRYGVRYMSNMTMSLDGVKVTPTWKPWAGYGYRKFTLKYAALNMAAGTHTVAVRIHDRANHTVNYSWSFTVAPSDSVAPVTTSDRVADYASQAVITLHATDTGSGVAHTYFTLDGFPGEGMFVVTNVVGPHTLVFWSVDKAGNTETRHTVTFTIEADMTNTTWHKQTTAFCTTGSGCHFASLTVEHYQHTDASGARLDCGTCHNSTDADVKAAIAAGSDACADCHGGIHHPFLSTQHTTVTPPTAVINCIQAGCHTGDLAAIHAPGKGCADCHANPAHAATKDCTVCHGNSGPHEGTHAVVSSISTGTATCTQAAPCHGTSVVAIHPTCATCHSSTSSKVVGAIAAGNATCETCHGVGFFAASHGTGNAKHVVSGSCFVSTCHGTDVTAMHVNDFRGTGATPPGCAACHAAGKTPSTNCTTCHADIITPHDYVTAHARVQPLLAANSTACVACHGSDIKNVLPAGNPVTGVIEHNGCSCHAYFEARNKTACEGCHNGAHAPHGFVNGVSRGEGWIAASGHNTANFGTIGAKTKFDGTQGVTLKWESEIASATLNSAYQTALGVSSLTAGQVGTLTTTWAFPTVNVFWAATDTAAPSTAIKGLTKDSVVTCQDCHAGLNAAGPHGAAQNWGIDPNYPGDYSYAELTKWVVTNPAGIKVRSTLETMTAMPAANATNPVTGDLATYYQGATGAHAVICAKCHDLENIGTGTAFGTTSLPYWDPIGKVATTTVTPFINTAAVGAANTAHASHHQDQADGSPQCVNCHIAIPHGWKAPRLLVNTGKGALGVPAEVIAGDAAPFLSPNALGTLRDAGGTGAIQFNKIGMLTLSATDQHTLTNGAAIWSEPSCQGCNIHLGEDGVRIQSGD